MVSTNNPLFLTCPENLVVLEIMNCEIRPLFTPQL